MENKFNNMKDCFKIVATNSEQNEYVIVIGNHLASEERFESIKKAEQRLNKTDWNLVSAFFFALKEAVEKENELKNNQQITEN